MASEEEEVYTEEESDQAMSFIREHDLPISELQYALRYVRIVRENKSLSDPVMGTRAPQDPVAEVSPPPFDWSGEDDQAVARDP
ncbi:uncharacterized protein LOC117141002 [Drosophila mauritiana]|uniref:Uncharacterized protein LOC117141002 n=1 Tax=Drosophila mauritiana TaxID=7226 RepID=A0A6P8KAF1_DROMA|nr:uncharacterized protein LOC117141002 [Drosophila mauritiana]